MTVKLLHTADCHLDSPLKSLALRSEDLRHQVQAASRRAFKRIIDIALDESVAALLIAGDLFDGAERSAKTAAFLSEQLDRLRAAGIRAFYIKGNHDAENPLTGDLSLPDNVHVFDGRGGKVELCDGVWIHGVSFSGKHAPDSLLGKFPAPVSGAVNIGLLHSSLGGAAGHDPYAPCSVADLCAMGFDYWALGHIHRRAVHAQSPWIVMPGIPQGRDIGESGPKSATLLTLNQGRITIEERITSAVEFMDLSIDVTGQDDDADLRDHLRDALKSTVQSLKSDAAILRVVFSGTCAHRWRLVRDHDVWFETLMRLATDTGRLWVEKLTMDLAETEDRDSSAVQELADLMAMIQTEEAMQLELRNELETILADLPAALRRTLLTHENASHRLAQELTRAGTELILSRMKGTGE